jgi:peptide/nickel transport system ATP-binding protein
MSENSLLLDVKGLKTYFFLRQGIVRAVDGVDFQIKRGQTIGLIGESGCGKSVTALSILDIVPHPARIVAGEILFHRLGNPEEPSQTTSMVNLAALDPEGDTIRSIRGAEISMIFQEPMNSLTPVYTIGDQLVEAITLHQKVSKAQAREQAIHMLERVGMPQPNRIIDRYPHQLSGGMRQRAMIAMALSCHPSLLIADEPTTALDVTTKAQILELMKELQRELGMAILYITHDMGVIAEIAEEVVVMYLGKVVEQGDVISIFHRPKHPYTQALLNSIPQITGEFGKKLTPIKGSLPAPYALPSGCHFHPRCPEYMPGICDRVEPELYPVGHGQVAACLLYEKQVHEKQLAHEINDGDKR